MLTVSGTPFEQGLQQGEAARSSFKNILADISKIPVFAPALQQVIPRFVYPLGLKILGKVAFKKQCHALKRSQCRFDQRLAGLTAGLKCGVALAYGLQAVEVVTAKLPFSMGCSSLVFDPAITASDHALLAYNHDFPEVIGPYLTVRQCLPQEGLKHLAVTYLPILGAIAGVNEAGIALSLNHAYALQTRLADTLPITMLVEECLSTCHNVEEVISKTLATPVPNGSMITAVSENGERAVIELAPGKSRVRRDSEPLSHTFNKYRLAEMETCEIPLAARGRGPLAGLGIHDHNLAREKRFLELRKNLKNRLDEKDIRALLSDHNGGSGDLGTICRHHPATHSTLASMILDPSARRLKITFGPPCRNEYEEHAF